MQKVDIFNTVKQIPFPEVQESFNGEEVRRGKIRCPFHDEKTPSFQVYDDGFKCFGCGEHGDSIDFIAKLENVRPIEAARLIAERFNLPVDRPATRQESQQVNELKRRRSLNKMYKIMEQRAFLNLIEYRDTVNYIVSIEWPDLAESTIKKVNKLPMVEEYLRILTTGSQEERLGMLREGGMEEWARLKSLQQMKKS